MVPRIIALYGFCTPLALGSVASDGESAKFPVCGDGCDEMVALQTHRLLGSWRSPGKNSTTSSTRRVPAPWAEVLDKGGVVETELVSQRLCGLDWQEFSPKNNLTSTQIVSEPTLLQDVGDFTGFSNEYQGPFVHPPSNFAFCPIAKNGCSSWTGVLRKLVTGDPSASGPDYDIAQESYAEWGSRGVEQVFRSNTSVRAVMIREPLARFASAFIDKCYDSSCTNPNCVARPDGRRGQPISFEAAVLWMLDREPRNVTNPHFRLQSEFCQLRSRAHEYTIIGYMNKDTFSSDASCIMKRAGIERFNADVVNGQSVPYWQPPQPGEPSQDEEELLKKLYTTDAARNMIEHLRQDYDVFNLPLEPAWVAEATGEWYAEVPSTCSTDTFGVKHANDVR